MALLSPKETKEEAYISGDVSENTIKKLKKVREETGKQQRTVVKEAIKAWLEGRLNLNG